MRVLVTADDIKQGRAQSSSCCPIALALQKATGLFIVVGKTDISIFIKDLPGFKIVDLPEIARTFVYEFDNCSSLFTFSPFEFEIDYEG